MEKSTCSLSCSNMQCFHGAFSGSFDLKPDSCSLPLVNPFAPVSPSYSAFFPALRQLPQLIRYPDPFLSQFPPPVVQGKQSSLLHPSVFRGSALANDLIANPALSTTGILHPVTFSKFLQTSFMSLVMSPAVGSKMRGADTWFSCFGANLFASIPSPSSSHPPSTPEDGGLVGPPHPPEISIN